MGITWWGRYINGSSGTCWTYRWQFRTFWLLTWVARKWTSFIHLWNDSSEHWRRTQPARRIKKRFPLSRLATVNQQMAIKDGRAALLNNKFNQHLSCLEIAYIEDDLHRLRELKIRGFRAGQPVNVEVIEDMLTIEEGCVKIVHSLWNARFSAWFHLSMLALEKFVTHDAKIIGKDCTRQKLSVIDLIYSKLNYLVSYFSLIGVEYPVLFFLFDVSSTLTCVVFITIMFIERSSGVMSSTLSCVFRRWIITVDVIIVHLKDYYFHCTVWDKLLWDLHK